MDHIHLYLKDKSIKTTEIIVFALQGGSTEATREISRQKKMEDNYEFVWKSNKKNKLTSSTLPDNDD